ncbi:MAG: hypothetical protein M3N16_03580 [Actinomycetota bacterium]|nr:hypothetical protein [Actinomycetota bacterium]
MSWSDADPPETEEGLRERLSRQGEETLGRLAEDLATNPMVASALERALQARDRAAQAQEAAMTALGIPSAADVERVTRRLRSLSQRLEGIEDALDRVESRLDAVGAGAGEGAEARNSAIENRLEEIARDVAALRDTVSPGEALPPRAQERLTVPTTPSDRGRPRSRGRR